MRSIIQLNAFGEAGLKVSMESTLFKLIGDINKRVASGVDYRKVLDFIFSSLESVIPYDRMGIALVNGEGDSATLKLEWVRSKIPFSHLDLNYSAKVSGSSLEKLLATNEPRILNDLIKYAALNPNSESTKLALLDGIRSSLTCPLKAGNKAIGVLFFSSAKTNAYRGAHVETFASIADELSLIVDHGRMRVASTQISNQSRNIQMLLHDLRSPLGIIQGFVQASYEEPWFQDLDSESKKVFEVILRNSHQMFGLLNEVLQVAELDEGADALNKSRIGLNAFYLEMRNFGQILADRKKMQFSSELDIESAEVAIFDQERIRRVFENLFSNAVKFSHSGQSIRMHMTCKEGRFSASVTDSGQGIPNDELTKLFTDYGKTSSRPTGGEGSIGLGLAISKKIVEQHGGEISVSSILGAGSKFSFWIPIS